jgi:hypothetical protein
MRSTAPTLNCAGTEGPLGHSFHLSDTYAQFLRGGFVEVIGLSLHWNNATMLEDEVRNFLNIRDVDIRQRISIAMLHSGGTECEFLLLVGGRSKSGWGALEYFEIATKMVNESRNTCPQG